MKHAFVQQLLGLVLAAVAVATQPASVDAAIDLRVDASRTNGVAPLFVFFDATDTRGLAPTTVMPSGDFVNASFRWQFDTTNVDPDGEHETVFGFIAAHVFEQPGTYAVKVEVKDATGALAVTTLNITAISFSGQTWYVAADGNDTNAGTVTAPWGTANFAFDQVASNTRILFRNGDTFPYDSVTFSGVQGPVIISSYSDPAQPSTNIPVLQLQNNRGALALNTVDFRVTDLHIKGMGGTVRGEGGGGPGFGDSAMHNLLLRVEVSDVGKDAFGSGTSDANGIVDCYGHDYLAYGIFAGRSRRLAFMGNRMRNMIGDADEHVVRIAGGEQHYICYNDFTETIFNSKTAVQIRGQSPNPSTNRYNVVSFNVVDRIIGFNPTNADALQYILDCLCEGNLILRNFAYTRYDGDVGINTAGGRIAIRNNVIVDYLRPINIGSHPLAGPSHDVTVYNNTVIATSGRHGKLVQAASDCSGIVSRNNIFRGSAASYDQVDKVLSAGGTNLDVQSSHNVYYAPGYSPTWDVVRLGDSYYTLAQAQAGPGVELETLVNDPLLSPVTNPLDAAFATLMEDSPARDSGTVVPVWYDRAGVPRPSGGGFDRGAYEYVPEPTTAAVASILALMTKWSRLCRDR